MDKIMLYNMSKTESITMPRTKQIKVGAKEESRKTTMVSGKIVKDVLGYRAVITAVWDYVPADTIAGLTVMLRQNSFVWLEYPSPSGFTEGWFEAEYPTMRVFGYRDGVAVWHDVTLKFTAKEVD